MSTRFLPPAAPKPLPDCQPFSALVDALVTLLGTGSTAVDDFASFLDPQSVHGADTVRRIQNKVGAIPGNTVADTLFSALEALHASCAAVDWNDRLGEGVECVVERLVGEKYPGVALVREQRLDVSSPAGPVASTEGFPVDVIAWNVVADHGEALEVKKALRSVVNDRKLLRKLRVLVQFKADAEAHAGRTIFTGLANLLDEEVAARLYLDTMLGGSSTLDVLTRDNCATWQGQLYL